MDENPIRPGKVGKIARTLVFALLALSLAPAAVARWAAFVGPDIERARELHKELSALLRSDLERHRIELRFEAVTAVPGPEQATQMKAVVDRAPAYIFAAAASLAVAAMKQSSRIPIFFSTETDPVRLGLVDSLSKPGRNATGFSYDIGIERKQLELLVSLVPMARTIGVLHDGRWAEERVSAAQLEEYRTALGRSIRPFKAADVSAMVDLIRGPQGRTVDAWLVPISNVSAIHRKEVVEAMKTSRRPAVFGRTFFVEIGGLASYQEKIPNPLEVWREMFHAVLDGIAIGEIPVRGPREFEMAINTDAARQLGISLPISMLKRADRVFGTAN